MSEGAITKRQRARATQAAQAMQGKQGQSSPQGRKKSARVPQGARDMALLVLQRVERGDAVQMALDQVLASQNAAADPRDAALCTEMVYGYLRTALRVEAVLAKVLKAPQDLPRVLQLILGLGVHSLLFLDKVPDHAVVNWCVERGSQFGKKMSGLTNAVLRSVQRLGDDPQHKEFYAVNGASALDAQCLYYSVPLWMGQLWHDAYGAESCELLLARSFAQPWPCARVNALREENTALRAALLEQGGTAVGKCGVVFAPGETPKAVLGQSMAQWHAHGAFSWQAAGSMVVLDGGLDTAMDSLQVPHWNAPVWDACAGQGGKSLGLMERGVRVGLCSDVHVGRLRQLRKTAERLRIQCPPVLRMQADVPALRSWPGTILLDAPCSGLGTMARRPEIRTRRTADHIGALAALQARMLRTAWQLLGQGGHVVYMTCTLNPAENEAQVQGLLRSESAARLVSTWQTPHDHPWLEGMYVAVLQKTV